jgi:hypothetical protein
MFSTNSRQHPLAIALCFLCFSSIASGTEFVRPRPLMEYEDILLAEKLDSPVSKLNDLLSQCIDAGARDPVECHCQHPEEVRAVKTSYEQVLQARPKWRGKVLFWKNTENMQSRKLILPAIENQVNSPTLNCD